MTGSNTFLIGAAIALLASAPAIEAEAQIRGAGRANIGGGHAGGRGAGMGARPSSGARPSGGARAPSAGTRPSGGASRPGGSGAANRPSGGDRINTGDRNSGNREINNSGNRINTGDVNIDVDGDHGWGWDDNHHHPIAAGVAFGAAAAVTSAVVGSMIYTLPPACSPYAVSYYYCGGVYYQPQYQGDTVVYVVVDQP
ncbi:MAG: hypothetical protein EBR82_41820 [Caulobacteraceae bacterium]|nr:hypothetical protein [Caulobacteraceae bacterium]